MKSTNISIRDLIDALKGNRNMNKPVGYARSTHGQFLIAFVATHPENHELAGQPVWTEDGQRVKLNWRVSKRQS